MFHGESVYTLVLAVSMIIAGSFTLRVDDADDIHPTNAQTIHQPRPTIPIDEFNLICSPVIFI
jgi:hypothetical protein